MSGTAKRYDNYTLAKLPSKIIISEAFIYTNPKKLKMDLILKYMLTSDIRSNKRKIFRPSKKEKRFGRQGKRYL